MLPLVALEKIFRCTGTSTTQPMFLYFFIRSRWLLYLQFFFLVIFWYLILHGLFDILSYLQPGSLHIILYCLDFRNFLNVLMLFKGGRNIILMLYFFIIFCNKFLDFASIYIRIRCLHLWNLIEFLIRLCIAEIRSRRTCLHTLGVHHCLGLLIRHHFMLIIVRFLTSGLVLLRCRGLMSLLARFEIIRWW